jgi:hypothetical protein
MLVNATSSKEEVTIHYSVEGIQSRQRGGQTTNEKKQNRFVLNVIHISQNNANLNSGGWGLARAVNKEYG